MAVTKKPTKQSAKAKQVAYENMSSTEKVAHDIVAAFGDLAPSVERIMQADLSDAQRHLALTLFKGSLNQIGDPNRDPRYAITHCGPDDRA